MRVRADPASPLAEKRETFLVLLRRGPWGERGEVRASYINVFKERVCAASACAQGCLHGLKGTSRVSPLSLSFTLSLFITAKQLSLCVCNASMLENC